MLLTTADDYQGPVTREMTDYEKARAWDRYCAIKKAKQINRQEIQARYDQGHELDRQEDNNYKQALIQSGEAVEQCQGCNYDICICERASNE